MRRVMLRVSCGAALGVLATMLPGAATAQRSPTAIVAGSWNGFSQNRANPSEQGPASVQVNHDPGSRLTAAFNLDHYAFLLDGRITDRRVLHLAGYVDGAAVTLDGRDQAYGGGSLAELTYVLTAPRRAAEQGLLLIIRDFADPGAPDMSGSWWGTYSSGFDRSTGRVDLELSRQAGSASRFAGRLTYRGQPPLACEGTIRADGRLLLVGMGPTGRFFAQGRADVSSRLGLNPSHAMVDYHVQWFDGSIDFGRFDLTLGTAPR